MPTPCPNLLEPLKIRGATLKNRIMSTGHDTTLPTEALVNEALIAYHEARAKGGAGLIVVQVAGVHDSARYTNHILMASDDSCIPGYRKLAQTVHRYGTTIFGQIFHPGREIIEAQGGMMAVAYAPSAVPNERFSVMPRPMSNAMVRSVIAGYGDAARRLHTAGLDGTEIVASHGYLPSQFLNPRVNLREDEYGGSPENRLRFLREVIADVRAKTSEDFVIGLRISGSEMDEHGLTIEEVSEVIATLSDQLDYVHVVGGSSATIGGAVHIVPPMSQQVGYTVPLAVQVKQKTSTPVFVTGRINQPQDANAIIAAGKADVCGMTRAMIADPEMPNKVIEGRLEDIRACIGCNQACIAHFHKGAPISCIQHPATGRELMLRSIPAPASHKKVMVVGGGPGGMKAAVIAAQRGHQVTLYEGSGQLGGQVLLAQLLPGRMEFGGVVTNLKRELDLHQVKVVRNTTVTRALVEAEAPDTVILATGGTPYMPNLESMGGLPVVYATEILTGERQVRGSVVVADWRCDWVGMGIAMHLAQNGCKVRLAVNGLIPGETVPLYVRDHANGELRKLGVEVIPYTRPYGYDDNTVYLQDTVTGSPVILEEADALVLAYGTQARSELERELEGYAGDIRVIGDCLTPRTAEEAIYDGFKVALEL